MTEKQRKIFEQEDTPEQLNSVDIEKENARAASDLDAKLHGKVHESRLQSLRTSTSGIETQVSIMNREVKHYAGGENQIDV